MRWLYLTEIVLRWLYVAGLAALIWRHKRIGRPLIYFEIYLWYSLIANAIYSPGHHWIWLATQVFMMAGRAGVLFELWYYSTNRMFPRESNAILLMACLLGLAWTTATWDVSMNDDWIRIAGHIRNRVHVGLLVMLAIGAIYIWARPINLHPNTPWHAAIFSVHLLAFVVADALWVRGLSRVEWFLVHNGTLAVNLMCLLAWALALSPWTPRAVRASSTQSTLQA